MKTKVKTTLVLVSTLLLGIIIGFLGNHTLRKRQQEKLTLSASEERLRFAIKRVLRPRADQQEAVDKILQHRLHQIAQQQEYLQNRVLAIYDSLRSDLAPTLTVRQRNRLERFLARTDARRIEARVVRLVKNLGLNAKQKEHIRAAIREIAAQGRADRQQYHNQPQLLRQAAQARLQKLDEQIEAMLTPEQQQTFRKMKVQH